MSARKKGPKSKATKFTHAKFCWLEQVARDNRNVPTLAPAVCIELCHYFNLRDDGAARVWQDALAQALGVRREAINKVIKALVERGHLSSTRCGRDQPNLYRMVVLTDAARCAQERTSSAPMMCDHDVRETRPRCAPQRTQTPLLLRPLKKRSLRRESLEQLKLLSIPGGGGAPLGAPTEEDQDSLAESHTHGGTFENLQAIWQRPWPDNEHAGRQAFDAARQDVAPADIVEAAKTWVAAVEPRYLPSLAKWLAGRGWEKPPPQKASRKPKKGRRHNSHKRDMSAEFFKLGSKRDVFGGGAS